MIWHTTARLPGTNTEQPHSNLIEYLHVATCELHKEVICLTNLQFVTFFNFEGQNSSLLKVEDLAVTNTASHSELAQIELRSQ